MHRRVYRMGLIMAFVLLFPAVVTAVPMTINVQGQLTDPVGNPVADGIYWIYFRIFDAETGGFERWSSGGYVEVTVEGGLFNYILGSDNPLPFYLADFDSLWLEMKPDGVPVMAPRIRLTSSMWSIRSAYSDTASVAFNVVGGTDPFWYVDDQVLTTDGEWGLARGAGNVAFGVKSSMINLGAACTTGTDGQGFFYGTISGGYGNTARANYTTVGGGQFNKAVNGFTTIGGGTQNATYGDWAVIGGGGQNQANGHFSTIAGGSQNYLGGSYGSVGGGYHNSAGGGTSTIGGGEDNQAGGGHSTIGGGQSNTAGGGHSFIGGGRMNRITDEFGVIGGGSDDSCNAVHGGILAGYANKAGDHPDDTAASIGGGGRNVALAKYATIGGGFQNEVQMTYGTLGGGYGNSVRGEYSTIGGGYNNTAGANDPDDERFCTIGGGMANKAIGDLSTISGGRLNEAGGDNSFIGGGQKNLVGGKYSAILGGYADSIFYGADYSYLFGINSNLSRDSTFMVDMPHIRFGDQATGYEFPTEDGSTGQVMATDGTGQVRWTTPSGGGWVDDGTVIALSTPTDKVGIGTSDPQTTLDVNGLIRVQGDDWPSSGEGMEMAYDPALNRGFIQVYDRGGSSWGQLYLGSGKVGIGTANPQDPLEVKGFVRFDGGAGGGSALRFAEGGVLKWALLYRPWAAGKIGFYDEVNSRWALAMDPGNARVGIGTDSPNYTLDVRGTIGNNTTAYHSDRRWKDEITTIADALDKVTRLRGVQFEWNDDEYSEMNFPEGKHLGLIAQEVEQVVPELVHTNADGYKSVEYAQLTAILIEAVKELHKKTREIDELKDQLSKMQNLLEQMEAKP